MNWVVVLAAGLLASLVLQSGLLAFAMYVMIGVFAASRYLARRWVESLTATRECDTTPVEAGAAVEVKVRVRNRGDLPVAWLLLEDLLPDWATRPPLKRVRVKGKRMKVAAVRAGKAVTLKYRLVFDRRGYYPVGPVLAETGDLFGLHRRHRVLTKAAFVMVYPKVLPLPAYDFASRRPVGEVRLAHRLMEDPTRNAGVRPYQLGDPLRRIHWGATARTGELHSRVYEPTSLAGATILIDFHKAGYHKRGEPYRSELAVTLAASLAHAVAALNQQVGLVSNGRDAIDRLREEGLIEAEFATRDEARATAADDEESDRLRPVVVDTRRGSGQFQQIREALARLELTDGLTVPQLVIEATPRLPRDATVIAILPQVSVETALALGELSRGGFAVSAILVGLDDEERAVGHGRLMAQNVRDVRSVNSEEELDGLGRNTLAPGATPYSVETALV